MSTRQSIQPTRQSRSVLGDPAVSDLYRENTLERFWQLPPGLKPSCQAAGRAGDTPSHDELEVANRGPAGPDDLIAEILAECQFGERRYQLSALKRLYYLLRPLLPRWATAPLRRGYRGHQQAGFPLGWPIEDRYVRFLYATLAGALEQASTEHDGARPVVEAEASDILPNLAEIEKFRSKLWPGGARFAFVLTHDVEAARGQAFVRRLADIDEKYGFRSSFNFVPEAYPVDESLYVELRARGFEIGVHGLIHDGRLFSSRSTFERRAARINRYLKDWQAVGFRSPLTHRNPVWMQDLEIAYDSSFFDTDPYEPMPGGTMSIWPFFCGRFVELPYTLAQDHTLLVVLGERTPDRWLKKVDFIARWGGMALLNAHPDYLIDPAHLAVYEEFLQWMAGGARQTGTGTYWHALPCEVAQWWRTRQQ